MGLFLHRKGQISAQWTSVALWWPFLGYQGHSGPRVFKSPFWASGEWAWLEVGRICDWEVFLMEDAYSRNAENSQLSLYNFTPASASDELSKRPGWEYGFRPGASRPFQCCILVQCLLGALRVRLWAFRCSAHTDNWRRQRWQAAWVTMMPCFSFCIFWSWLINSP